MMAVAMSVAFPRSREGSSPAPLDAGVLARCCAQDPMAFRAFVVRYERMVFALLSRMLGHGPEVEDLAQEAFVRAYRAFPDFDSTGRRSRRRGSSRSRRASRSMRARRRSSIRRRSMKRHDDASTGSTPELAARAARARPRNRRGARAKLPDDQRAALVLAEIHGLSIAEIADALERAREHGEDAALSRARKDARGLEERMEDAVSDEPERSISNAWEPQLRPPDFAERVLARVRAEGKSEGRTAARASARRASADGERREDARGRLRARR